MTLVRRRGVWLVQQGVWDMPKESMPLAAGYLKAAALQDEVISEEMEIRIFNFNGGDSLVGMAETMFREGVPDVIGFSVFGWNYQSFGKLAEAYKQFAPAGWVIFGGTHVANQAHRVFREFPDVDVVANGEGEFVFRALLRARLAGREVCDLHDIDGISFRTEDGRVVTTAAPERIPDLDAVPSPFLTGAIPLTDARGEFRYDVALIETNRGCPYKCAFCYWGGAIGQKVRSFSRERLRAELEIFGFHKVHTVVLCDANFGMLQNDLEFVEDVIHTREKFGFPRAVEGSWAKNKSKVFYDIVRRMKHEGMRSSFTLALQTLDESALEQMHRRNMRLNDWEDLVRWLASEGLDCYAELIWGAPGETYESFLDGYDRLAHHMTRIAVYPLLLLPNTEYSTAKDKYGFTTVRGEHDDFEYVLAHNTMTIDENLRMKRFMLWARAIAEHMVLRHVWTPLRKLAGLSQSTVVRSLMDWFVNTRLPAAVRIADLAERLNRQPSAVPTFLREIYAEPSLDHMLTTWWTESIAPLVPAEHADLLTEILRYDLATRPIFDPPDSGSVRRLGLDQVEIMEETYYRRRMHFSHDVSGTTRLIQRDEPFASEPRPTEVEIFYKAGFHEQYANHEEGFHFVGQTADELLETRKWPASAIPLSGAGDR